MTEAESNEKTTISVVYCKPGERAETVEMEEKLETMQAMVGGLIQEFFPFHSDMDPRYDDVALICNDEGKLMGLTPNRLLRDSKGKPYDMVCGTFFLVGLGEEDFQSLSPELTAKYNALYRREWLIALPKEPPGKGPMQNTPERRERS